MTDAPWFLPYLTKFIADCTRPGECRSSELYEAFLAWCKPRRIGHVPRKAFKAAVNAMGYPSYKNSVGMFRGVELQRPDPWLGAPAGARR